MKPGALYEYNWTRYRVVRAGKMSIAGKVWIGSVTVESETDKELHTITAGLFLAEFKRLKE